MDATLLTYLRFAAYVVLAGTLMLFVIVDRRGRALHLTLALYFFTRALVTGSQLFRWDKITLWIADWTTTPLLIALIVLFALQLWQDARHAPHDRRNQ